MPLAVLPAPFNHRDWLFEPKLDGFRAVAYIDNGTARLVSRKGNVYKVIPEAHGRAGSGAAGE
jgi:ATP-dependent DNA ligase